MLDILPGDTLYTNDYVELHIAANMEAYVYVIQWLPDGTPILLFPSSSDIAFDSGVSNRVPTNPSDWYQLDDNVGMETVYVIASRKPISRIDEALGKEIHALRDESAATAPMLAPAPPAPKQPLPDSSAGSSRRPQRTARPERMLTMANRGLRKVVNLDGHLVVDTAAPIEADQLVVASFSFYHAR